MPNFTLLFNSEGFDRNNRGTAIAGQGTGKENGRLRRLHRQPAGSGHGKQAHTITKSVC